MFNHVVDVTLSAYLLSATLFAPILIAASVRVPRNAVPMIIGWGAVAIVAAATIAHLSGGS
jgi:hypothetical protein